MGKFIVITGLDASGKDTVAAALQELDPGSYLVKTPTDPFIPARSEMDALAMQHPWTHYHFYLASIYHASSIISELLRNSSNVYCVRYLLDTVCYHRGLGLPVRLNYTKGIRRPDLTIFLAISDEGVRQRRLGSRGRSVGDEVTDNERIRQKILEAYRRYDSEYVLVDNTFKTVPQVVGEIRNIIEGLSK
ncbi:MAG: hypothetical protein XU08_C0001G0129 [candidate division WWE3 bacterium CSP1-7]|uniref:Thymidylate kinase-like domain-containing protein n=1 Tax=candidate division WWE3 bacterium CSP1-7 TaxID=1576480 RepID=A0A0T5ZY35_UNCKA|nr:MAG: hypothetical protein XU08_C0001G0129 [candidate division WWE3 bacterium CSP1-7]